MFSRKKRQEKVTVRSEAQDLNKKTRAISPARSRFSLTGSELQIKRSLLQ